MAFLYSLDNNVPVQSSNLGMVSCFTSANFAVEHRSSHEDLLLSVERMYRQAPSARSLLSQNPWCWNVGSIGTNDLSVDLDV